MKKDKENVNFALEPVYGDPGGKKGGAGKVVAIVLIVVSVVAALGAGGMFMWKSGFLSGLAQPETTAPPATEPTKEFTFEANTKVSGMDISGKTVGEAKTFLEQHKEQLIRPVTIALSIEDKETALTQEDFSYTFHINDAVNQIWADADKKLSTAVREYAVEVEVEDDSVESAADAVCEAYDKPAVDAHVAKFHPFADKRFDIEEGSDGYTIDRDDLVAQLQTALSGSEQYVTVKAATTVIPSNRTVDEVKKNIVKLASYETVSTNSDNATHNMKKAMEACNGSIIEPGAVWSFNECTGDSNLESNGYKSANVISEGRVTQGIGGGICQSSSTIYNAAILANMGIEERYCHKWASLYVPTGLDATIDYPGLDLKLQNTSDYQMFLECKVSGSTLHATIWGCRNGDYDEIRTRNEKGKTGDKSYEVRAWRVYYKDGKKVGEEELFSSDYDLENGETFYSADGDDGVVYAGPGPLPKEEPTTAPAATVPQTTAAKKQTE